MKYSKIFGKTIRHVPQEVRAESYRQLLQAGYIRSIGSGLFVLMPLGFRVMKKIEQIIREEMEQLGGQEVLAPLVNPHELWKKSGRSQLIDRALIRFKDRHGRDLVLAPSHEELMVEMVKDVVNSYRDFPVFLFQFQIKFRDEEKVRCGLIRSKEFLMKDAYSFHRSFAELNNFFPKIFAAYERIFKKLDLDVFPAEAGVGYMGGSRAYEFFMKSDLGDDIVISCPGCGYTANSDIAKGARDYSPANPLPIEEVHTPDCTSIEDLSLFLDVPRSSLAKTMVYKTLNSWVVAVVRGDYDVSQEKLALCINEPVVRLATETELEIMGLFPGFLSPIGLEDSMRIAVDETVANSSNLIMGANKKDYHLKNVNFGRDFESSLTGDIAQIKKDDTCLLCGGVLHEIRAIELGHIFKLGNFYSKSLNLSFMTEKGDKIYPEMGSYGIGLSRLLAAIAEVHHDEKGLCWPEHLAPFTVFLMGIGKSERVRQIVNEIYNALDVEILLDGRSESPGVKFKDADLLGIPYRIIISTRWLEQDKVEVYIRKEGKAVQVPLQDVMTNASSLPWKMS
ncbi:MAG: proline--tRNA ligase [Spirochaetales bacterium]|nr:proline--tRNA ligase [Spirochaetales bacterium]